MAKISDEKRAARRAEILDAAWRCFQAKGLHATTMDNIIEASGLSAGAVYSYFTNKDDLIHAALTTSLSGIAERLASVLQAKTPPPPDILLSEILTVVSGFTAREGYDLKRLALLGWSEAQHNERVRATMQPFYLAFRDQLAGVAAAWRRDGIVDAKVNDEAVSRTLLALIMGFVAQAAIIGDVSPETIARGTVALTSSSSERRKHKPVKRRN